MEHEDCKYLIEGCYLKDSWLQYDACTLEKDGLWDYKTCDKYKCTHLNGKEEENVKS